VDPGIREENISTPSALRDMEDQGYVVVNSSPIRECSYTQGDERYLEWEGMREAA
jgi:hypothetical protein